MPAGSCVTGHFSCFPSRSGLAPDAAPNVPNFARDPFVDVDYYSTSSLLRLATTALAPLDRFRLFTSLYQSQWVANILTRSTECEFFCLPLPFSAGCVSLAFCSSRPGRSAMRLRLDRPGPSSPIGFGGLSHILELLADYRFFLQLPGWLGCPR